jgi:uncharacterized protein (TIGR02996 family)
VTEQQSLIAAICLHPAEDTPRLAFADWLEEHDDPARAEFVRKSIEQETYSASSDGGECTQCYHARLRLPTTNGPCRCTPAVRELRGRVNTLLRDNERRWLPPWWPDVGADRPSRPVWNPRWRRGFVDRVDLETQALHTQAAHLFRECPLQQVRLDNKFPHSFFRAFDNPSVPLDRWQWRQAADRRQWSRPDYVGPFLFGRMARGELRGPDRYFSFSSRVYVTLSDALTDLTDAVLAFGRAAAFPEPAGVAG